MDINDILGTTYSAVKHNSDLLYMEEDFEREHRTDQLRAIQSIAESAASQAKSAEKEIIILREQLRFAEKEAADAKKKALFADIISILSIAISIVMPLIESLLK